ncbi:protein stum [Cotesia glomerata]|nr:protein stum [Cotesia glomerata]XP_044590166.1 protein stum [Cotesia glomerata]
MRRRFDGFEENTRRYRRPRLIDDDHVGFRLLDPSANVHHQYYLDIPEPPRAPEPYKISGASSSMTRAHRRSSFVILADAIEPTSRSVGGSPTHEQRIIRSPLSPTRVIPGGRSSPFRPRGFKGPLPHAQSRPQSPPVPARRFIQPKSLSQGNSPRKQSLIPQPRGGLVSHRSNLKNKERDKWERRSGRYVTKIPRSSSLKTSRAKQNRPAAETIRGARPSTKSVKNNATNVKSGGVVTGTANKAGVPGKANGNPASKSPDKKINRSPTKIPVRYSAFATGGVASNNGGGGGGGGGRFIKISDNNSDDKKEINSPTVSSESSSVPATTTDESVVIGSAETSTPAPALQISADKSSDKKENDHGLIDLLKHPAKGEGTKSVVSATTTTAVQPLKIDATNIIPHSTVSETAAVVTSNNENNNSNNNKDDKKILPEQTKPNSTSKVDNNPEAKAKAKEEIKTKEESKDGKIKPEDKPPEVQEVQAVVEPINVEAVVKVGNGNEEKKTREDLKIQETKAERSLDEGDKKLKTDETDRAIEVAGSLNPVGDKRQENGSSGDNERTDQGRDKGRNHGSETSLKSSNGLSTGSVESIRSTDTGVSLNTVRGVSSAREKRGTHVVKRSQEIETLSGNVMHVESQRNGEPAIVEVTEPTVAVIQPTDTSQLGAAATRRERFLKWRNSAVKRLQDRWSNTKAKGTNMKCFNFRSHKKNVAQLSQINQQQEPKSAKTKKPNAWSCFKPACCRNVRAGSRIAPAETTTCCRPEKSCCFPCKPISWCRLPSWCSCKKKETTRDIRAKHSLTSVAPPPLSEEQKSKIPDVLIEHNSVMRAAIPCLPVPLAWFCLVWNVLLPGTGTIWSGLFNLCIGQPRFAATSSARSRLGAFIVDIIVGVSQAFTVLFCLVGWGWSIWWGVTMIRLARKWKRFKAAEASSNDLEAGGDIDGGLPAPGVPTQALREMERAR